MELTTSSPAAAAPAGAAVRRAARSSNRSGATTSGNGAGDNVSAALLWTLRANSEANAEAATPAPMLAAKSATATARRGPGRPKKADANAKSAAKWDDTVTALLLQFRYVDMRGAFEGVRNNVEVGECWIHLASEISRLSGKSFDSHQCQSKLRNLKKNWRELSKSSKAASASPLYAMLGQYLSNNSSSTSASAAAGSTDHVDTSSGEQGEPRSSGFGVSHILRRSGSVSSATEEDADGEEHDEDNAGHDADDPESKETEEDESDANPRRESCAAPEAEDVASTTDDRDDDGGEAVATAATEPTGSTRPRSDSSTSSACSSDSRAPKRLKQLSLSTHSPAAATETTAAPALCGIVQSHTERIDSNLLTVASGLRTMMEGVIASKEEAGEQGLILAELREHNLLMKRYCEEVSKQTTSLNSLIELLAAKFGANGGK